MKVKHAARVAARLNDQMYASRQDTPECKTGSSSQKRQNSALDQMLSEHPRSCRSQCQAHGRLALPNHGAGQQQIGHVGADDEQQHSNKQHQNPQGACISGVERTKATAAGQSDQFGNLLRFEVHGFSREATEQTSDLRLRGRLRHAGFQAAHFTDPPITVVFAARSAVTLTRLKGNSHCQRRVNVSPLPSPQTKESGRSHSNNASWHIVDADAAV